MPRERRMRKRGCSSSSSASSRIRNYRLNKRAILVGRTRAGFGGSRSSKPVPTTTTAHLRNAVDPSPKCSQPVSARRLAATLWEMNEMMPSPKMSEINLKNYKYSPQQQQKKKNGSEMVFKSEKMQCGWGLHMSDPLHSPSISENMDRCGTGIRQRTPSISQRLRSTEQKVADFDCISNASFMEVETRSRPPTSSESVSNCRNRLKDVSNSLTTSKELLKIINRMWAHEDQPSSSTSVISALHTELERARLQVNHLIQEKHSDKNEISHLIKCFDEEKKSWKNKENRSIEAAIVSIANELEMERKLRRRLERLNKKLGVELTEVKSSFIKVVKELENEKRAREITEEVCDELTSESIEVCEGVEKERVQTKMSEARLHQFKEKNSAISKMRRQLEVFIGSKRDKDDERGTWLRKSNINQNEERDEREVENGRDSKEESVDSELNKNNDDKTNKKWAYYISAFAHNARKKDEIKARNSVSGDGLERERLYELEKGAQRRSCYEERQRYKPVKGIQGQVLSSTRLLNSRLSWTSKDRCHERQCEITANSSKSRMGDVRGECQSTRSKW